MTITRNELEDALRGAIEGLEPLNFLYASWSIRHGCIEQRNIGGYHEAGTIDLPKHRFPVPQLTSAQARRIIET